LFVYDAPSTALSRGERQINAPTYFARLAQTMVSWLSTATAEGVLYQVDLRLRPEGEAGAIATSLKRLETYFADDAWIWEKLALAKARPIAGDAPLKVKLHLVIHSIVNQPHDHSLIGPAIDKMLMRIRKTRKGKSKWHLRARYGGLFELDLLIQGMRLQHGDLFEQTGQSIPAILVQLKTSGKINANHAEHLQDADRLFSEIHQCLRLTFGNSASAPDLLPPPLRQFILARMDLADEQQLTLLLETTLETVLFILNHYLTNDPAIPA
jgi:glutamate-ammonia-ligase adenylyltransferase